MRPVRTVSTGWMRVTCCGRTTLVAGLVAGVVLLVQSPSLHAQPAAPNYLLSLGGTNGFLELPSGAFNDLEEVTIEGWVKSLLLGTWWNPAPPFGLPNSGEKMSLLP